MVVQKLENGFLVKVYKEYIDKFDFFDKDNIQELFQKILTKILEKYELKGLVDVDVYVNNEFGLIIEFQEIHSYFEDIDLQIHFHIGSVFLFEIELNDIFSYSDVYYYKGKFYGSYHGLIDSSIFYKGIDEIIEKGIKVC